MCIQGHIYKIIHLDSNLTYIGSTCDSISGRWRTHKSGYNKWLSDKEKYDPVAIYPYFEQYGIDRFKMIQIKSYDVYDKKHLYVYEQLAMNKTKCVNKQCAFQLINTDCMRKHYRRANKQSINEKALVKVTCECGTQVSKSCLARHKKTQKHLTLLAALSN